MAANASETPAMGESRSPPRRARTDVDPPRPPYETREPAEARYNVDDVPRPVASGSQSGSSHRLPISARQAEPPNPAAFRMSPRDRMSWRDDTAPAPSARVPMSARIVLVAGLAALTVAVVFWIQARSQPRSASCRARPSRRRFRRRRRPASPPTSPGNGGYPGSGGRRPKPSRPPCRLFRRFGAPRRARPRPSRARRAPWPWRRRLPRKSCAGRALRPRPDRTPTCRRGRNRNPRPPRTPPTRSPRRSRPIAARRRRLVASRPRVSLLPTRCATSTPRKKTPTRRCLPRLNDPEDSEAPVLDAALASSPARTRS